MDRRKFESYVNVTSQGGGGGGGGTLNFSAYVGSGPASTLHSKNIWNSSNPNNIPILYNDLKKRPLNT